MTTSAFGEAQRELVRILAHHMILVAERAHVIPGQGPNGQILENAHCLWEGKAVFSWNAVELANPEVDSISTTVGSKGLSQPDFGSTGSSGEQSQPFFGNDSTSTLYRCEQITFTDKAPVLKVPGANANSFVDRCVSCESVLDSDGLCRPCLLLGLNFPIDDNQDHVGDPVGFESQIPAITDSASFLRD